MATTLFASDFIASNNKKLNISNVISFKAIKEQLITDEGSCQLFASDFIASNNKKLNISNVISFK
ncbi:hypothetical protein, partial [Brachyspira hyodysenteriae]|uniref:hypothetical protein n=1 Tax=Brachyspira hyodysenteriae TaxID=159 RepID=UPI0011834759